MSEAPPRPALSEFYKPATVDTVLVIRFAGNTADVVDIATATPAGVTPGQLWGAIGALQRAADRLASASEAEAERRSKIRSILTGHELPPTPPPGDARG